MSFSSNFLNLIIDANCDLFAKSNYLDEGRHFHYFSSLDSKQVEQIKQKINSFLSLHNKRLEGFVLLNRYLDESSHLIVPNESVAWATYCLQSSTSKNAFEKQVSFVCLRKIFKAASNSPEIYRMLSGTVVPQFIDLLSQMKLENADLKTMNEFCGCFEICLKTFKGPFSSRRKLVEDFILGLSSSSNFQRLAKSFALLAFTASNKQMQANNFVNHLLIMSIYTLDTLMDADLNETHQLPYYLNIKEQPLLTLSNAGRLEKILEFVTKFKFFCSVIQHSLDESFNGLVKIPITLILNLIQRVISLKIDRTNTTANLESILNMNIIPTLYENALMVLNQLITTCSTHLSTNLKEINKILIDSLENFDKETKCYLIELKSLWYKVICNWFDKMGNHLTVVVSKQWIDLIIENFFKDIQVKKVGLQLQHKKQITNERIANIKLTENHHFSDEEFTLCLEACRTMNSFSINFSRLIDAKKFHKFVNQLLMIVQDLYRIELWRNSSYFVDSKLRLSLLKVFRSCLVSFMNTSLLNNSITLFNTILKLDKSSEIQQFAKETLIIINSPRTKVYFSSSTHDFANLVNSQPVDPQNNDLPVSNEIECNERDVADNLSLEFKENHDQSSKSIDEMAKTDDFCVNSEPHYQINSNDKTIDQQEDQPESEPKIVESNEKVTKVSTINGVTNEADKVIEEEKIDEILDDKRDEVMENKINEIMEDKTDVEVEDKVDEKTNDDLFSRRTTRSKKSSSQNSLASTTRLTRSVKKKLEENEQVSAKKPRIEHDENLPQKQVISEDNDLEVEEILKDFVDA